MNILLLFLVASASHAQENINQDLLNFIFNISATTTKTDLSAITVKTTEATATLNNKAGEACQCVPYYLCNIYDVADGKYDPNITGWNLLDVRFGDDECQESVEKCCKEPDKKKPEDVPKPDPSKLRGCGYRNPRGLQVTLVGGNGDEAQFGEFPWVTVLLDAINGSYVGVGAIIHPQVVLTGAHIAYKYAPGTLKIRAGEWDTQTVKEIYPHQERDIQRIFIHPNFNSKSLANDIALLHLEKPLELAEHINMICLADQGEVFDSSKNCVANGWGKDHFGLQGRYAVFLKKIEVDMVEHSTCNSLLQRTRLGTRFRLDSSFVCAGGEEGKDACTGDGGAPLACPIGGDRYKLTGLVAWGIGCGQKDVPAVYASLPALRSWVDDTMSSLGYGTSTYTL